MSEEIKEILDTPIFVIDNDGFTVYINDKIENYITNLQKENEKYKKIFEAKERFSKIMPEDTEFVILTKENYDKQQKDLALENIILKSRNEKAFKLLQLLHYKFADGDSIHHDIEDIQKELQGGDE